MLPRRGRLVSKNCHRRSIRKGVNTRWFSALLLVLLGSAISGPEPRLHLKARDVGQVRSIDGGAHGRPRLVRDFRSAPPPEDVAAIEERGATVVGVVPETGLIVAADPS